MIEYNPAPPFRSGSPSTAPADLVQGVIHAREGVQRERRTIATRVAARLDEIARPEV
jgi:cyclohexyl-isocyanide hydratase